MGGSFEILQIFGTGAFGTVCLARDLSHPARPIVAVKVLQEAYAANPDVLKRTRDEARMLKRLRHPHIVRVKWLMQFGDRPVVGMEWVEGASVDRVLQRLPDGLPAAVSMALIKAAASALDAAYYSPMGPGGRPMCIIHRDMKPANLLISVDGAVKVADFGQAKGDFVDREAVSIEMVLGSRGYMAPERVGGHDGQAGDTYALGLSLFELLTGRKVVVSLREDKHDPGVAKHQGWLEPPELQGEWRARLRELFGAMCAYDPSQRPSPGKVARELEWIAAGAGLQADLHAFAAEHVRPLLEPPGASRHREHPRYPDIAFLEREIGQMVEVDNRAAEAHDARDRCEALLSDRDWPNRVPELRRLMNDSGLWAPDALLAVLDDATRPWWRPFGRRVPAHEVLAALELLHTHPDDAVRARAARLATHDDPRVASLAREIAGESAAG